MARLIFVKNPVLNGYGVLHYLGVLQLHPRVIWLSYTLLMNTNTESHGSLKIYRKQLPGVGCAHVKL